MAIVKFLLHKAQKTIRHEPSHTLQFTSVHGLKFTIYKLNLFCFFYRYDEKVLFKGWFSPNIHRKTAFWNRKGYNSEPQKRPIPAKEPAASI